MSRTWIERIGEKREVKLTKLICHERRQEITRVDYLYNGTTEYRVLCHIAAGEVVNYFPTLKEARHFSMKEGREIVERNLQYILNQMYG